MIVDSASYRVGWKAAADELAKPYPEDLFRPLTKEEERRAIAAMNEAVTHASERMHAAWARHWAKVLREMDT